MKMKVSRVWLPLQTLPPHSCKHPDKHCLENNTLLPNVIKNPTHVLCALEQNLRVFGSILPCQLILRIPSGVWARLCIKTLFFHLYHLLKVLFHVPSLKEKGQQ